MLVQELARTRTSAGYAFAKDVQRSFIKKKGEFKFDVKLSLRNTWNRGNNNPQPTRSKQVGRVVRLRTTLGAPPATPGGTPIRPCLPRVGYGRRPRFRKIFAFQDPHFGLNAR